MALRVLLVSLLLAGSAAAQAPTDPDPTPVRAPLVAPPSALGPGDTAWGYDARYEMPEDRTFVSFRLDTGSGATDGPNVLAPDGALVQGCDYDDVDLTQLVCISAAGALFRVEVETGDVSPIGTGSYAAGVADLTYSVADDAWYALVSDCAGDPTTHRSALARVDPATGAATALGEPTDFSFCGLGLAAAPDGTVYAYSAETSAAVSRTATIDPVTGAFSILGITGLDAFFAQSMDCDASDGACYAFGYIGSGVNGLFELNPASGFLNNFGELPEGAELTAAAIATTTAMQTASEPGPRSGLTLRVLSALPASRTLRLWADGAVRGATVEIYDALGRLVLRRTRADGGIAVDVSGWAPGAYVVRLAADGAAVARLISVAR